MSISTTQYAVATSHGSLTVEEHGNGGTPVLLIHGNSYCRGVFKHQLHGKLAENYRFIALTCRAMANPVMPPIPVDRYASRFSRSGGRTTRKTAHYTGCGVRLVIWRPYRY